MSIKHRWLNSVMKHVSDSSAQREAEPHLIAFLNQAENIELSSQYRKLGDGITVQLDGIDENHRIICEVFAHIGKLKSAQIRKIASDMLKLLMVEKHFGGSWRKILCFADEDAAKTFQGNTWRAKAVKEFNFEIVVVPLPSSILERVTSAQKQQKMINA